MFKVRGKEYAPCRIFCIGCNYAEHIRELGSRDSDQCVIFMKPYTSLVKPGMDIILPRNAGEMHHELELVVLIGKQGNDISEEEAPEYIAGLSLGLDLTLRDVQSRLKKSGHPWELCKAFEQSAPVGEFVPFDVSMDLTNIRMICKVNEETRQNGNTKNMIFPVKRLIEILSCFFNDTAGAEIYTGTPEGVGPVLPGDAVSIESPDIGRFSWNFV